MSPQHPGPGDTFQESTDESTGSLSTEPAIRPVGLLPDRVGQQLLTTFSKTSLIWPSVCPWFRASAINPPIWRPTAESPRPRACLPRSCPAPRAAATTPRLCPPASPGTLTISANRRNPFRVREKLVQAAQQPGAVRRSESAMVWTRVPRGTEDLLAGSCLRGRCTPSRLASRLAGKGAPGAKEGVNHRAEQKRAGLKRVGPGGHRPGSPLAPPAKDSPRWALSPQGAQFSGAPVWQFCEPELCYNGETLHAFRIPMRLGLPQNRGDLALGGNASVSLAVKTAQAKVKLKYVYRIQNNSEFGKFSQCIQGIIEHSQGDLRLPRLKKKKTKNNTHMLIFPQGMMWTFTVSGIRQDQKIVPG